MVHRAADHGSQYLPNDDDIHRAAARRIRASNGYLPCGKPTLVLDGTIYDYRLVSNLRIGINDLRIFKTRFKYDLCKFFFTKRVIVKYLDMNNSFYTT